MRRLLAPIVSNLPLFLITILLLGGFDVAFHQYHFNENDAWGMFLAYGEMILMAYLICLCSHWLRKIHLQISTCTRELPCHILQMVKMFPVILLYVMHKKV